MTDAPEENTYAWNTRRASTLTRVDKSPHLFCCRGRLYIFHKPTLYIKDIFNNYETSPSPLLFNKEKFHFYHIISTIINVYIIKGTFHKYIFH